MLKKSAITLAASLAGLSTQAPAEPITLQLPNGNGACNSTALTSTPIGLMHCMRADNIIQHLQALQNIADINDGNRASGEPGYDASVEYVRDTLESAGYEVDIQTFPFTAFEAHGASLEQTAPAAVTYEEDVDFTLMSQTDPGDVTAAVTPVDLQLGMGNTSTSGCESEDFAGFPAGNIALIQRGACAFGQKAENAAAAGASGVIVFNQGDTAEEDRTGLLNGTLGAEYSGGIPVLFATYALGEEWASTAGLQLHMVADVEREMTESYNVIAQTRRGNPNNVIMVGAHLDSVPEGAGINDNGSGSAAILELALLMRKSHMPNAVRFAWWGAEESGLIGSTYYVDNLAEEEKAKIAAYLNFDMIGSPNGVNFVYDGDGSAFDLEGPDGSAGIERLFEVYFYTKGSSSEPTEISFRSDYAAFFDNGIPFGGLFTGAEGIKTEEEAVRYGGTAGEAYDPCYHQACDDITNVDSSRLGLHADGVAFATGWLALTTGILELKEGQGERKALRATQDRERWGDYYLK